MRDIDIEIEGYLSDMLYDQQSIQGMKWSDTFSKVKNATSVYMTLRKMTDLDAAATTTASLATIGNTPIKPDKEELLPIALAIYPVITGKANTAKATITSAKLRTTILINLLCLIQVSI